MSEIEYRNRSISQLVSQLNSLGEAKVVMEGVRLLGVHQTDIEVVKRFKNSNGEQFFIAKGNDRKYGYDQISQNIHLSHFRILSDLYSRGFNVTLMISPPRQQARTTQFLSEVGRWMGEAIYSCLHFGEQNITDMVGDIKIAEKDVDKKNVFYRVKEENALVFLDKMLRNGSRGIGIVKIRKIVNELAQDNQLSIICLPEQFFSGEAKSTEYLSVVRSQLSQIFNYLKVNHSKKYQHFSKLLTKRLPVTNAIASLVLQESLCMVINWINDGSTTHLAQKLSFYDKIKGRQVLLKLPEGRKVEVKELPYQLSPGSRKQKQRESKLVKTDRTPVSHLLSQENQLEYCRSFQRKTHKYSVHEGQQQDQQLFSNKVQAENSPSQFIITSKRDPSPVLHSRSDRVKDRNPQNKQFDQTLPRKGNQHLKESQEITILKAEHAIQVSQYHQTIQQLNKKILVLTQDNKLEQLYTIHERELMMLELKIKELRNDITQLCQGGDQKSYKAMVRKLNEEVKRLENRKGEQKVSGAKMVNLEKQLQETKKKYQESQSSRKKLAYQLQYLTKRLKICDAQIEQLNNRQNVIVTAHKNSPNQPVSTSKLSVSDVESLRQVEILLGQVKEGSEQASRFLMRKITNVLEDLSAGRNIILDCNDFLVQLEEHLEEKLGGKEPQIVLDCNKFIRNFLMDNLKVF